MSSCVYLLATPPAGRHEAAEGEQRGRRTTVCEKEAGDARRSCALLQRTASMATSLSVMSCALLDFSDAGFSRPLTWSSQHFYLLCVR
eukprot:5308899-Pleurochrysis_carterae.AAC.3